MIDRAARRKKSASGSERKRTVFTLVVLGAVAVGSMGLMLWRLLPQEQAVTPIGTVDGLEITREELLLYAEGHRAAVAKHFAEACGVKAVQDFWSASFDGECPGEMVKERALADLKRTKTEQKCMLEQGILSDAGYDGFLQEFFEENRRRREMVAAGGTLYGPEEYSEREFFLLLHEKRRDALIQKLAKTAFSITGEEKRAFYQHARQENAAFLLADGAYRSYESVEPLLEKKIAEQRYRDYLEQREKQAVVQINDRKYRSIRIQ